MSGGDDTSVSGPMTVVRLRDGTLDLVPVMEFEEDGGVYAREPPHQLLGCWREGRWVRIEEMTPVPSPYPRYRAADELFTSDPAVMGGRRVFRGTRVPVECLWENLDDGLSVDEILDSYPTLDRADVVAVIERRLR